MKEKKKLLTEQERDKTFLINKVASERKKFATNFLIISRAIGTDMPRETLLETWYLFSKGIWSDKLPGKPEDWENKETLLKNVWAVRIREEIENIVGTKSCARYEREREGIEAGQAFDDLWDSDLVKQLYYLNHDACKQMEMLLEIQKELSTLFRTIRFAVYVGCGLVIGWAIAKLLLILIG